MAKSPRTIEPDLELIGEVAAAMLGADTAVERTEGGVSAFVYRVDRGDESFFLRLAEETSENLEVDALVHVKLRHAGVRVPEVIGVEAFNEPLGCSIMAMRHIGGSPIWQAPDGIDRVAVVRAAGVDLARINQIPVEGFGWVRRDAPTWPPHAELDAYADFVVHDLPEPWPGEFERLFSTDDLDTIERVIAEERQHHLDRASLAHGDMGLDHIFHVDGQYTGIIDFGEIRGTEPLFDLGVYFTTLGREDRPHLMDAMLEGYAEVTPLPDDVRHRMRVSGTLKVLRQMGRWLQPDFPFERDPQATADTVSRRLLPLLAG